MLFSSLTFLFVFLPVVLLVNFFINPKFRNIWLLLSSLFFYIWGEQEYSYVILLSIVFNYFVALAMDWKKISTHRKKILWLGIAGNLLLLGFYKYFNFILANINKASEVFDVSFQNDPVHLPIGISFFTFQAISYIADVYTKKSKAVRNPLDLGLYITLFPQLIAGPIVQFNDIKEALKSRIITLKAYVYGIDRFLIGLAKKVIIANGVSVFVDDIFSLTGGDLTAPLAWLGVIAYSIQIYFDFSGYSDMAIGIGRMLGFKFVENFNFPYISKNIGEFWRRWNISLGSWFREYVYIPLGGSRVKDYQVYFNLGVVFLLTGIWHGASWNFVIWGIFNGAAVMIERLFLGKLLKKHWVGFSHVYALLVILFNWVFFRADSLRHALSYIKAMILNWDFVGFMNYIEHI